MGGCDIYEYDGYIANNIYIYPGLPGLLLKPSFYKGLLLKPPLEW